MCVTFPLCAYAELMTDLDVAEIGHLLLCSEDFAVSLGGWS